MSSSMIFGSPAFQAKLADSQRKLREGYGQALAAKQQHTIRLLPPQLLPHPLPGSHAPGTTTRFIKKDNLLKVVRPQQSVKKPTVHQRSQRLQKLGRNVNLGLPLHHYPAKAPSTEQAQAPVALVQNPNPTSAITKHSADTAAVACPKTFDLMPLAAPATAAPAITRHAAIAPSTQQQLQAQPAMTPAALGHNPNPAPTITKHSADTAAPRKLRVIIRGLVPSKGLAPSSAATAVSSLSLSYVHQHLHFYPDRIDPITKSPFHICIALPCPFLEVPCCLE